MTTVKVTRTINAPSSRVWAVLSDFSNVQVFHPLVQHVDQISEADRGLGAERRCNFYSGGSAVEKITEWKEEGQSFTCIVSDGPAPILDAIASMGVNKIDSEKSEVYVEMKYVPKWGILGKIIDVLMLRFGMRYTFNKVLAGLEHHVETGELIGKNGKATIRISQVATTPLQ